MTMTKPTSEQVTFTAVGSGATLRNLVDKVREVVSVKDFGAVGDGVTDDFDAFIAAVNAVKLAGGGTVHVPATANGYYLRYGAFCDLGGTSNISIVSDGATLKLQGGTPAQTLSAAVFTAPSQSGITNFTCRGLRFVAASTVLRDPYDAPFAAEVTAGRADANEVTSFRYAIAITGPSTNVAIEDCHFGPGIYEGIDVKNATPKMSNVMLRDLSFDGVNAQCIQVSDIDGLVISDIVCTNKRGSKFDWLFYGFANSENVTICNIVMRQSTYVADFGTSGVGLLTGCVGGTATNIIIENVGSGSACIIGNGCEQVSISNLCIRNCGTATGPALALRDAHSNVVISNLAMSDCPWAIWPSGGTDVLVDGFLIENSNTYAIQATDGNCDIVFRNGKLVDCAPGARAIRIVNSSSTRKYVIDAVDCIAKTFSVGLMFDIRGAATTAQVVNCTFANEFASSSGNALFVGNSALVTVGNCQTVGYTGSLTASSTPTLCSIEQLPAIETVLTVDSATPSVAGNKLFVTANTMATSYTNFTGGVQGQEICIRVNDANTTFDFSSTSLKGNDGVDYAATSGDVVFAKRIGSNWYCTICQV